SLFGGLAGLAPQSAGGAAYLTLRRLQRVGDLLLTLVQRAGDVGAHVINTRFAFVQNDACLFLDLPSRLLYLLSRLAGYLPGLQPRFLQALLACPSPLFTACGNFRAGGCTRLWRHNQRCRRADQPADDNSCQKGSRLASMAVTHRSEA